MSAAGDITRGRRPAPHHLRNLRAEVMRFIDGFIVDLPTIRKLANDEMAVYPSASFTEGGRGGAEDTPVERVVIGAKGLRTHAAGDCEAAFWRVLIAMRQADDDRRKLMERADAEGLRVNAVDLCTECNGPIAGKIKRLDGEPYHDPYDLSLDPHERGCYGRAIRRRRPPDSGIAGIAT